MWSMSTCRAGRAGSWWQFKARPNLYSYASVGSGTAPHFAAELFKLHAGVEMVGRSFNGAAPAVDATIAGLTQFMFPSLFTALPQIRAGRMRALAVAGPDRVPALPDLPTLAEEGVEGLGLTQWYALFAPARTPQPVIDDLNKALNQALASEATIRRIEAHGAEVMASARTTCARWCGRSWRDGGRLSRKRGSPPTAPAPAAPAMTSMPTLPLASPDAVDCAFATS